MNLNRTLDRIDTWLLLRYNFALNVVFFMRLGYPLRRAWQMASDTL